LGLKTRHFLWGFGGPKTFLLKIQLSGSRFFFFSSDFWHLRSKLFFTSKISVGKGSNDTRCSDEFTHFCISNGYRERILMYGKDLNMGKHQPLLFRKNKMDVFCKQRGPLLKLYMELIFPYKWPKINGISLGVNFSPPINGVITSWKVPLLWAPGCDGSSLISTRMTWTEPSIFRESQPSNRHLLVMARQHPGGPGG